MYKVTATSYTSASHLNTQQSCLQMQHTAKKLEIPLHFLRNRSQAIDFPSRCWFVCPAFKSHAFNGGFNIVNFNAIFLLWSGYLTPQQSLFVSICFLKMFNNFCETWAFVIRLSVEVFAWHFLSTMTLIHVQSFKWPQEQLHFVYAVLITDLFYSM